MQDQRDFKHSIELLLRELVEEGDFTLDHIIYAYGLLERYLSVSKIDGNLHLEKLFSIAAFVAHKFLEEEENWYLPEFSILSRINVAETKVLEEEFCHGIEFRVFLNAKIYGHYCRKLKKKTKV